MKRVPWDKWLRAAAKDNPERLGFGARALGRCTGQDFRALTAVDACWELYSVADESGELAALQCVRELLTAMQPSCWIFARALIARSLDWPDRDRLWPLVLGGPGTSLPGKLPMRWPTRREMGVPEPLTACDREGCERSATTRRGPFRFCAAHAALIDDSGTCLDCAAGNCGVHSARRH